MSQSQVTVNLVCPGCTAVNRIPDNRLADRPVCGNCRRSLVPDHPVDLTEASFHKFVSRTGVPVIVDFWAEWCGPCRMMAPAFAAASKMLSPGILLAKLNTDDSSRAASSFNIASIPCLIAFRNGKEVARRTGVMSQEQIVEWAKSVGGPLSA